MLWTIKLISACSRSPSFILRKKTRVFGGDGRESILIIEWVSFRLVTWHSQCLEGIIFNHIFSEFPIFAVIGIFRASRFAKQGHLSTWDLVLTNSTSNHHVADLLKMALGTLHGLQLFNEYYKQHGERLNWIIWIAPVSTFPAQPLCQRKPLLGWF